MNIFKQSVLIHKQAGIIENKIDINISVKFAVRKKKKVRQFGGGVSSWTDETNPDFTTRSVLNGFNYSLLCWKADSESYFKFNFTVLGCTDQLCAGVPSRPNSSYCNTHTINVPARLTSTTGGRLLKHCSAVGIRKFILNMNTSHTATKKKEKESVIIRFVFYSIVRGREVPAQRWFKEQRSLQPCSMSGNTHTHKKGGKP